MLVRTRPLRNPSSRVQADETRFIKRGDGGLVNILHTEAASHLAHLSQIALGEGWENINVDFSVDDPHSYNYYGWGHRMKYAYVNIQQVDTPISVHYFFFLPKRQIFLLHHVVKQ